MIDISNVNWNKKNTGKLIQYTAKKICENTGRKTLTKEAIRSAKSIIENLIRPTQVYFTDSRPVKEIIDETVNVEYPKGVMTLEESIMSKETRIPLDTAISIVTSEGFYNAIKDCIVDNISGSVDIAHAINSFSNASIAKPVICKVNTADGGILDPDECILVEINDLYYKIPSEGIGYTKGAMLSAQVGQASDKAINTEISDAHHEMRKALVDIYKKEYIDIYKSEVPTEI